MCRRRHRPERRAPPGAAAGLGETYHLAAGDAAARGHQDELIAQAQAALGDWAFAAAWEASRAIDLGAAVRAALAPAPAAPARLPRTARIAPERGPEAAV
jgi:hypothetical protein